jgi:hypothetical protein
LTVVISAPPPLAIGLATHLLVGLLLGWLENFVAVAAAPFDHTGVVAPSAQDLETAIEYVPRPRPWPLSTSKPAEMLSFYSGADIHPGNIPFYGPLTRGFEVEPHQAGCGRDRLSRSGSPHERSSLKHSISEVFNNCAIQTV